MRSAHSRPERLDRAPRRSESEVHRGRDPAHRLVDVRQPHDTPGARGGRRDRLRRRGGRGGPRDGRPPARRGGPRARRLQESLRPGGESGGVVMTPRAALWLLAVLALLGSAPAGREREHGPSRMEVKAPELPRRLVATAPAASAGPRIDVPGGADLQAVLDRARPGDTIELAPGATVRGPFVLGHKP